MKNIFIKIYLGVDLLLSEKAGKKKMTSHIVLLSYKPNSTANPPVMGQIGCADWLVTQKDNVGNAFFPFPAFAYKSRPTIFFPDRCSSRGILN